MIDWLGGWLRELVIIILLASFADLLLPNQVMQKYAKAVIGLFILLVLLTPIMMLFHSNFNLKQVHLALDYWPNNASLRHDSTEAANILSEGRKLQDRNEAATIRLIEQRMADMIMEDLEETGYGPIANVSVKVLIDDLAKPYVDSVSILLGSETEAAGTKSETESLPGADPMQFEPVESVEIHIPIDIKGKNSSPAQPVSEMNRDSTVSLEPQVIHSLKSRIAEKWQIDIERILIEADGG